ncbi:MAG TPA: transglycosylase SLT domain-containing protein [Geminicoccaceae bacterium]|nr:transglycosylase SLT domain-containing protein [Geminicoccaceae bacterium]
MSAVPARRLRLALAALGGLVAAALPLAARAVEDCGAIAERLERSEDIPPGLLHAVALAESGRAHPVHGASLAWPWTVRSGDDSFYLPSKELALSKVRELRAAGRSNIDVGCMQINLGYHGNAFASLDDAFDPASNVAYGARFLRQLRDETSSWAEATGRYHSADADRGQAYRARVWRLWRELRRRQGGEPPAIAEAAFVDESPVRLAGGAATSRPGAAGAVRVVTPSGERRSRPAGAIAVLRGR